MIALLLFLVPLIGGLLTFLPNKSGMARSLALGSALLSLAGVIAGLTLFKQPLYWEFDAEWLQTLGSRFSLKGDAMGMLMSLLTSIGVLLAVLGSWNNDVQGTNRFYGLLLWMQAGMMVVFLASDALLFYFGWELALIPAYFLCSIWGGEKRIAVTFKFFIYTFVGSVLMLIGLIYLQSLTPNHSFQMQAFRNLEIPESKQVWLFWLFFLAFAIKVPVFPFHTWQPDTYTEAPTAGTMLLSGIMLKMGIYGVIRWLIPIAPLGFNQWGPIALALSIIGVVYAAIIAFTQKDVKRLVAYSSISHVGLIAAGIFVWNVQGLQGAMIQMLNHGINVVGMFFVLDIIIRRLGTREMSAMGGIAKSAPQLAITFLIVLLGSVALPLTNGFIGEFLLLMGLYQYNLWAAVIAGLTIIFGAVYMLRAYQHIMLGESNKVTAAFADLDFTEKMVLYTICGLIILIGVFPQPILNLTEPAVNSLLQVVNAKILAIH